MPVPIISIRTANLLSGLALIAGVLIAILGLGDLVQSLAARLIWGGGVAVFGFGLVWSSTDYDSRDICTRCWNSAVVIAIVILVCCVGVPGPLPRWAMVLLMLDAGLAVVPSFCFAVRNVVRWRCGWEGYEDGED
jgi:hypothetical protein